MQINSILLLIIIALGFGIWWLMNQLTLEKTKEQIKKIKGMEDETREKVESSDLKSLVDQSNDRYSGAPTDDGKDAKTNHVERK